MRTMRGSVNSKSSLQSIMNIYGLGNRNLSCKEVFEESGEVPEANPSSSLICPGVTHAPTARQTETVCERLGV